jgi:uncharacterized DUF497 family protein
MKYEWDPAKAKTNLHKHGVEFADAVTVFADPLAATRDDDDPDEERFVTLGLDASGQLLVVVYTWRGSDIRIVSARKATRRERREYER